MTTLDALVEEQARGLILEFHSADLRFVFEGHMMRIKSGPFFYRGPLYLAPQVFKFY